MAFPYPVTTGDITGDAEDMPLEGVPLGASLTRRFYLPLILLSSLVRVFRGTPNLRMPELEAAPADVFKAFVNKLGHICDSAKGGDKVTSFAILQLGSVRYYFTSNRRDEEDYQRTAHYITDILNALDRARDDELLSANGRDGHLPVFPQLLRMIIGFNQSRIMGYVCRLVENIDACIWFAREDGSDEGELSIITVVYVSLPDSRNLYLGQAVLQSLEGLQPLLAFSGDARNLNECMAQSIQPPGTDT
jgi:hypothetical protein